MLLIKWFRIDFLFIQNANFKMSIKVLFSQNVNVFNPLFPVLIQPTSKRELCKGKILNCDLLVMRVWR